MINVLKHALPLVGITHPNVTITCRRYKGHTVNAMGVVQPEWEEFTAYGQVQHAQVSKQGNAQNIDVAQRMLNVWIQAELHTVETQPVADQVVYMGKVWNVKSLTNWMPGNRWGTYTIVEDKYSDAEKKSENVEAEDGGETSEEVTKKEGGFKW